MKFVAATPRSAALGAFVKSFHYDEADPSFALERIAPNGQVRPLMNLTLGRMGRIIVPFGHHWEIGIPLPVPTAGEAR